MLCQECSDGDDDNNDNDDDDDDADDAPGYADFANKCVRLPPAEQAAFLMHLEGRLWTEIQISPRRR